MPLKLRAFWRHRPRILTLVILVNAALVIALANLSFDQAYNDDVCAIYQSYGWPIVWHRLVRSNWKSGVFHTVGWYYSAPRLAVNLVIWLTIVAALGAGCEWMVRRYARPRWSIRTMLVGVAAAAVLCGWFARTRHRAKLQKPVLAAMGGWGGPQASVQRSGPKWLDLIGLDYLRQRVVAVGQPHLKAGNPDDEQLLQQLSRLPDLRHLCLYTDELSPSMADALRRMRRLDSLDLVFDRLTLDVAPALSELRRLRSVSLNVLKSSGEGVEQRAHDCLAAIAKLPDLEAVELRYDVLRAKNMACLAELKNLRLLSVHFQDYLDMSNLEERLTAIGSLTQLEWLELVQLKVSNESLARLAGLTNLKTLILKELVTDNRPMLSHLPQIEQLQALDLSKSLIDDDDLDRLAVLPRLRSLRLGQEYFRGEQLITPAGLKELAFVTSLEEIELDGDIESAPGVRSLLAVKHLKKVWLGSHPSGEGESTGGLRLDNGKTLYARNADGLRRSLQALREAKPGIIINHGSADYWERRDQCLSDHRYDTDPVHKPTWLPGSGDVWMTPAEQAAFAKAGGWVSFYGAACPDRMDGSIVTARF